MRKIFLLLLLSISTLSCGTESRRGLVAENAMVVTAHPDASRIGLEILKKGGNAYDAAIATQFALAVCYPVAGNIGGGGFLVYRTGKGRTGALDFREMAPGAAHRDMYLDSLGNPIAELSQDGHLSAGVPGTVDGMIEIHKKLGSLPWRDLVQPAIELAYRGVVLTEREASNLNSYRESFLSLNTHRPYLVADSIWSAGERLYHSDLAHTLERIRERGREGFYAGETADMIVHEMQSSNGIITHEDLKNYHSVWRTPVTGQYKGYRIISMPPPSSGGIALIQLLTMVEPYELRRSGWQAARTVHVMAEAERRVYADRAVHLGDPDFHRVAVQDLLGTKYLHGRMKSFQPDHASSSADIQAGRFTGKESEETTHFSIVDKWGNAASITTTLNDNYGAKVVVQGAGFLLNDEMDDFSAKPGTPNMFGLVGGEANAIAPGKRMLSSMTPTIVEKNGRLFMVLGTPGGSTIITSVFQTILNVIEHRMGMQEAVDAPRFHHQWLPDQILMEDNAIAPGVAEELEKKGHTISTRRRIGSVEGILVLPGSKLEGGADQRGDSRAMGY